jgi:hypothetical protein
MRKAGVVGTVKLVTIPQGLNKILFRLENLADHFDLGATQQVNIKTLVEGMWRSSNESEVPEYSLTETSVTGNMPVEEMQARRLKWKTVDDGKYEECKI